MTFEHVHIIINPAAGRPQPILHSINPVLHDAGINWRASVTTAHYDATTLTREAVKNGADLIVSYGGDGTVKGIVNGLIGSEVPLALLHGGTGNAMAHQLGIPVNLTEAARLITGDYQLRAIDVGKVICEDNPDEIGHFMLRASIGLQNRMLEQATPELKAQFGNLAYLAAGLQSLGERETIHFRVTVDGETIEAEGLSCIIANSAALGGEGNFAFAPGVEPDDGALDVFVLNAGFDSLLSMVNSALETDIDQYPNHWRGKSIRVEMDEASTVTIDGESFGETPITTEVIPQAVQVVVPS